MLFKLNWGTHRVSEKGAAKIYKAGEIIRTDAPLDTQFPMMKEGQWKFEAMEETPVSLRPAIATVVRSPSKSVEGISEQIPSTATIPAVAEVAPVEVVETIAMTEKTSPPVQGSPLDRYGEDVTTEFKQAPACNFQVRFDGKLYYVIDVPTSKRVNKTKKLDTPKSVRLFLKKYVLGT